MVFRAIFLEALLLLLREPPLKIFLMISLLLLFRQNMILHSLTYLYKLLRRKR